jgi:hypothetical protein
MQIMKNTAASMNLPENGRTRWPFAKMEVGDVVRADDCDPQRAQVAAHSYARASGKTFATKTLDGVMHIWRVK